MNGFLIQCKIRKTELLQYLGIMLGGFVLGFVILLIIVNQSGENESATAGTMIAVILLLFVHFFSTIISFVGEFNTAVSMGATRKNFVISYAIFNMIEITVLETGLFILGNLEKTVINQLFPGIRFEIDMTEFFAWKYMAGGVIEFTILEIFFAAVLLRFGMKAFWVLWAIWMLGALLPGNISHNEKLSKEFTKIGLMLGGKITSTGIFVCVAFVLFVIAVIGWRILRKQQVTV